jgi:hypothetical protein
MKYAAVRSRIIADDVDEEKSHLKHIRSLREQLLPGVTSVKLFSSGNIQQRDRVDGIK